MIEITGWIVLSPEDDRDAEFATKVEADAYADKIGGLALPVAGNIEIVEV